MSISPEQRELAQTLFEGARERKPEERAAYLENACPSDAELREYVLRMVASDDKDPGFLETPVLMQILNSPLLEEGDLIEGRYRIIRLAGLGGMGEVYEAEDTELSERVALKTVRRDLTGLDEAASRLRREIQLVHRISHANVCKVHHLGVDRRPEGDLLFLTMDFLEGEPLSDFLERTGPLPREAVFPIAMQIADGLDAAHAEGVIHRDLKSSNIMLVPRPDGTTRAVITDFGVACTQEEDYRPSPGTPAYMAPERMNDPDQSSSADIYSFGVILYEMVTGRLPFDPGTPLVQRRKPPPAPSTIRRGVGRRWDRVILRSLDPSPRMRFARAAALVDALRTPRWPVPVAACLVPLLLVALIRPALLLRPYELLFPKAGPVQALAILPFDHIGGGIEDGLTDHLAEQIQKSRMIRERWLVFTPAEIRQMGIITPAQARAALGASHVLAGTVVREPEFVTVAGRLLDVRTSQPAGSFQKICPPDNTICLQDGMLQAAAAVLVPRGISSMQPAPISAEAFPYYLQGLHYLRQDSVSYNLAIPFLQQALAKDPQSPQPRVLLADAYMLRFRDTGNQEALVAARKILDEVLATHPGLPELHASLGNLHRAEGRYEAAIRELQVAEQGDASNHIFHLRLAHVYDLSGLDAEAVAEFQKAIQLQPRYWLGYLDFAVFHHRRGRFQGAAALLERLIEWAPDHAQGLAALGGVYVDMGRNADAERVSARSCQLKPTRSCFVNLGFALQRQRRTREAIVAYEKALSFGAPSVMLLLNTADAHAYLGERAVALDFFRQAVARAEESLKVNLQNSGLRAILAYCLAQIGDRQRAEFELDQALRNSPNDKNVRKYAVLTYESTGQRDKALETLRSATKDVLKDLELAWGTEQLRQDPRYPEVAQRIGSK